MGIINLRKIDDAFLALQYADELKGYNPKIVCRQFNELLDQLIFFGEPFLYKPSQYECKYHSKVRDLILVNLKNHANKDNEIQMKNGMTFEQFVLFMLPVQCESVHYHWLIFITGTRFLSPLWKIFKRQWSWNMTKKLALILTIIASLVTIIHFLTL